MSFLVTLWLDPVPLIVSNSSRDIPSLDAMLLTSGE